ncbi:MAG: O-antigen ligase family protein [Candidatus Gastranaerophilales bacterium]|nr:O-antigen ligase family protein [Candidatus Gastranaerophilales bacterium]
MYTESRIYDIINTGLSKVQDKLSCLTENSFLLSNLDNILIIFVCLSFVVSIFCGNSATAPFLCLTAIFYILTLFFKKGAGIKLNTSSLFLLLYFVTAIISTINSTMPKQSVIGLSKTILYLLFFCGVMQYFRLNRNKIIIASSLIAVCVSFETIVAFLQNYFDVLSAATWQDTTNLNPELVLTRVYGTLKPSNPNLLGGYFIVAVPFLWMFTALSFADGKKLLSAVGLLFSVLSVGAIFMTGCRGAYMALFVMLVVLAFAFLQICKVHYKNIYDFINTKKYVILGAIASVGVALMICVPKISHRILSIFAMRNDSSTSFRMNVYNSSIQMFQDNFLMGIGCGNKVFREIYGLYMLSGFDALSAYSVFLETAVESGIFALIFYILFLFFLIKHAVQKFYGSSDLKEKIILTMCVTAVCGVIVHGFVDTVYFRPQIQLVFWLAVAMIYSYSDELEKQKN